MHQNLMFQTQKCKCHQLQGTSPWSQYILGISSRSPCMCMSLKFSYNTPWHYLSCPKTNYWGTCPTRPPGFGDYDLLLVVLSSRRWPHSEQKTSGTIASPSENPTSVTPMNTSFQTLRIETSVWQYRVILFLFLSQFSELLFKTYNVQLMWHSGWVTSACSWTPKQRKHCESE